MKKAGNDLRRVAERAFGWAQLRPGQLEAMEAALAGRDVLAVMPTGHGKSAVYQVPALLLAGPTVVVSPLISLQRDQVAGITDAPDAPDGVVLNSAQRGSDRRHAWEQVRAGGAEFLFLAPEQVVKDDVLERLSGLEVSLVVVDEAHCVSAWGHDFRPDYLRLREVVDRLGHPPVVALTATAAPPVREEIITGLGLRDPTVVVRGFDRPNLRLAVSRHTDDGDKRQAVVEQVADLAGQPGVGLLYVATRKDTERYAAALADRGVRAAAYHAGRKAADRREAHRQFLDGEVDLVVATSAFGMGIDKPDVRFVVHASTPESLDSYYQQIGRAGRDGEPATAHLHHRPEDLSLGRFFASTSPDEQTVRALHRVLRRAGGPMRATALAEATGVSRRAVSRAANLLEEGRVLHRSKAGFRARDVGEDDAVRIAEEVAARRERVDRTRVEMIRGYADTRGCRRQFLLGYFGDDLDEPCGNCDTCEAGTAAVAAGNGGGRDAGGDAPYPAQTRVQHREWGTGVVMSTDPETVTVLFDTEGYRTLDLDTVREQDLLAQDGS